MLPKKSGYLLNNLIMLYQMRRMASQIFSFGGGEEGGGGMGVIIFEVAREPATGSG